MKIINKLFYILFFGTESVKSGVYLTVTAHLHLD